MAPWYVRYKLGGLGLSVWNREEGKYELTAKGKASGLGANYREVRNKYLEMRCYTVGQGTKAEATGKIWKK